MKRKIVDINQEKCNGCGLCIAACHEGALQLVNGKAQLVSETYCDGIGACLPECPAGAITIEEREAAPYDEKAAKKNIEKNKQSSSSINLACECPGSHSKTIEQKAKVEHAPSTPEATHTITAESQLRQWPCQIKLVPVNAPYFDNAHLLVAADCTAYAYANIHQDFMRNKITLIGCPKLDNTNYAEKLTDILNLHDVISVTVLRMEVPCCGGIVNAAKQALINSGKMIPWRAVTISTDGSIIEE